MSEVSPQRRPRRNGVYWGDKVVGAARALRWRKTTIGEKAKVAPGTVSKLWLGYNGGGPVEEYTAAPVIDLFKVEENAQKLANAGIDPNEVIIPQEFRFIPGVTPLLLSRIDQLSDAVKRLNRDDFGYISKTILARALSDGGCFTRRHMPALAQLAYDELRRSQGLATFNIGSPADLYIQVQIQDAYPSAYRETPVPAPIPEETPASSPDPK